MTSRRRSYEIAEAALTPHHIDARICFSIYYYTDEQEAILAGSISRERGNTYNGGLHHGKPCGREPSWDYTGDDGTRFYAATF